MRAALLLLAAVLALPACGSVSTSRSNELTYAQVQSFNRGVEGEWILSEYANARNVSRRADGTIRSMGFMVDDPQGRSRPLMLHFDENGILERKQYGGPHVRPPERSENVGFGS